MQHNQNHDIRTTPPDSCEIFSSEPHFACSISSLLPPVHLDYLVNFQTELAEDEAWNPVYALDHRQGKYLAACWKSRKAIHPSLFVLFAYKYYWMILAGASHCTLRINIDQCSSSSINFDNNFLI